MKKILWNAFKWKKFRKGKNLFELLGEPERRLWEIWAKIFVQSSLFLIAQLFVVFFFNSSNMLFGFLDFFLEVSKIFILPETVDEEVM